MPAKADDSTQAPVPANRQDPAHDRELTPRELDVLWFLTRGLTNTEIAQKLSVSVHTVKFHLGSIYRKLGVSNRTEAVAAALASNGGLPVRGQPWDRTKHAGDDLEALRHLVPLDLPGDGMRRPVSRRYDRVELQLDVGDGPASALAAFAALAGRYTGRTSICVAVSREPDGLVRRVSPVLLDLDETTFRALADDARSRLDRVAPLTHEEIAALLDGDPEFSPLTQLRFSFHGDDELEEEGDFDLALHVDRKRQARLWFDADLFSSESAARLLGHMRNLLAAGTSAPGLPLQKLSMLSDAERRQLLVEWNQTSAPYPDRRVDELVAERAASAPDRVAVVAGEVSVTYGELDRRANQLAHVLQDLGIGPNRLVGLCIDRNADLLVALLAVMKSGGAYVPLDPSFPTERLAFMLEDSGAQVVLVQEELVSVLPETGARVFCLDRDRGVISESSTEPVASEAHHRDAAVVIYTSGSTGVPKGVETPHGALVNLLTSVQQDLGFTVDDVFLATTTLSFDIAAVELYLPLLAGGQVAVAPTGSAADPWALADLIERHCATYMQATPSGWRLLLDGGWSGREGLTALTAGEALTAELADSLLRRVERLWNYYGPTETTIYSTGKHIQSGDDVTIGRPVANTEVYILDDRLAPTPIGVPGELYIGGHGLARGYLERPELTGERFVSHPFDETAGARIYRTGDLARYRSDGEIAYLGRLDHQVKVRGYRIELGEIETALARHASVISAVATTREDKPGDVRLVAYVIPAEGAVSAVELRRFLGETLPSYMVPTSIVSLTEFPLTPNGKIDRKALPAPTFERDPGLDYVAPRTPLEQKLASIWENVLDIHPIGVTDDFFELGVTSIVAAQLFAVIERKLRTKLPLAPVFQAPTIERLAALIESGGKEQRWTSLVPIQPNGSQTPIFCVHGGAGTVLHLQPLARRLGEDQPFYGLQARGLYGEVAPLRTVEDMAAHYISELREVQPEGPYDLAGYCFGGIVAFEMAQRLRAAGEEVRTLVMFNAPSPLWIRTYGGIGNQPSRRAQAVSPAGQPPRSLTRRVAGVLTSREKIAHYAHHYWWRTTRMLFPARFWLSAKLDRPLPEQLRGEYFLHLSAVAQNRYQADFYPGEIMMFYGEGLYDDPELGWGPLAERVESYSVPGEHRGNREAMAEPLVAPMAERLDEYLESVRREPAAHLAT